MSRLVALALAGLVCVAAARPAAARAAELEAPPGVRLLPERTSPDYPGVILPPTFPDPDPPPWDHECWPPPTFPDPDPCPWDRHWWPPKPIPVPTYPRPWQDPFGPCVPVDSVWHVIA